MVTSFVLSLVVESTKGIRDVTPFRVSSASFFLCKNVLCRSWIDADGDSVFCNIKYLYLFYLHLQSNITFSKPLLSVVVGTRRFGVFPAVALALFLTRNLVVALAGLGGLGGMAGLAGLGGLVRVVTTARGEDTDLVAPELLTGFRLGSPAIASRSLSPLLTLD